MDTKQFLKYLAHKQGIAINEQVAVKAESVSKEAELAVKKLEKDLGRLLGNRYVVQARYQKNLGSSILLMLHHDKPANKIPDNSPVHMKIMMHLSSNFGKDVDLSQVSWEFLTGHFKQRKAGINFRKINSKKSIDDATNKLIDWFKKNKSKMDSLIKDQDEEDQKYGR